MVKQTAGRDQLGGFAPKFAELNDDVLFGEVWSREESLSLKTRSILTVSALVSKGLIDSSVQFHQMLDFPQAFVPLFSDTFGKLVKPFQKIHHPACVSG